MDKSEYWRLIHAERARLADLLEGLDPEQWATESLCSGWSVEQVVAHISAAANTGTLAWLLSMARARLDAGRHNDRLLARYRGSTPAETLEKYRDSIGSTVAPANAYVAILGEAIVHGQDIARPLGIELAPDATALRKVARFFANKDFTVNSRSLVEGLSLAADDASFETGSGPAVRGNLLDLVMTMAGRPGYAAGLTGKGADELRRRLGASATS